MTSWIAHHPLGQITSETDLMRHNLLLMTHIKTIGSVHMTG